MAILTINSGSSSLKLGLHDDSAEKLLLSASVDGIAGDASTLEIVRSGGGASQKAELGRIAHVQDALSVALERMGDNEVAAVRAVGHRVVHGGPKLVRHQRITPEVLQQMEAAVHFAPLHIPPALDLIRFAEKRFPAAVQVTCFDTAFHQTMPPEAYTYAIPEDARASGVRRFGFHGLSYESAVHALGNDLPTRAVVAHLGSGASACALLHRQSVDTSMGLSPTGGFPMATRPGDLDPEVVLFLLRDGSKDAAGIDKLEQTLNHACGLKALAGDADMRSLLQRAEAADGAASLAVHIFCRSVAKTIAAYAAVLGGLDMLVFSGGIGEHSAAVRARICEKLAWLGVLLDSEANAGHRASIGVAVSNVSVRIVKADENSRIAAHTAALAA